jgi:large subunit ribosomal protein L6
MSKIGKTPIIIPEGVTVEITPNEVVVKGSKGELRVKILINIKVEVKDNLVVVSRKNNEKHTKSTHGLTRSLINNCIEGVVNGYKKTLNLVGTGYRVTAQDQNLSMTVGFSHPVKVEAVEGVKLTVEGNNVIHIEGIDKQQVGQMAANIRAIKPPEPYKGKGIKYSDEVVRRKAGKAAVT